jgi:hypothetical protein
MRNIYILIFILFISCVSVKRSSQQKETYYFFFDAKSPDNLMKKYHSWRNGPVNFLYHINKENIIFTPKDWERRNNPEKEHVLAKDTANLNPKYIKWLNSFNGKQIDSIFIRQSNKDFYIIEKDTLDNKLYIISVVFTQEIH